MTDLHKLFYPNAIAIVGASRRPGKIGYMLLKNLIEYGYKGKIYPVNPNADEILGLKSYPSVSALPGKVDVVVVTVPAAKVPEVIEDAGKAGTKFAVVISSGFKEVGNIELENKIVEVAHKYGMRILGPNIFGYVYTPSRINASFGPKDVIPGNVAFVSQSGALGIALIGTTILESIGVSAIISIGNKSDLDDADFFEFFEQDPNTSAILVYMEGAKDGRRFIKTARKTTRKKPIIIVKAGRTEAGAKAAASHTGSLAGNIAIYEAAFKQSGIIMAKSIEEAFDWVKAFSWNPLPVGENLVIITNGGGAGVQASDSLADYGVYLKNPPEHLVEEVKKFVPPFASLANPIDLTGMAQTDWYYKAVLAALKDPDVHAIIVLYCHTAVTEPMGVAEAIASAVKDAGVKKPMTVAMIGGVECAEAVKFLTKEKIVAFPTPERAAVAMATLYRYLRMRSKIA